MATSNVYVTKTRRAKRVLYNRKPIEDEEILSEKTTCSICLDVITVKGRLPVCNHDYCFLCILEWSKKTNSCPVCKRVFRCISKISFQSPKRQVRVPDVAVNKEESFDEIHEGILPYTMLEGSRNYDQYDLEDSFIDDSLAMNVSSANNSVSNIENNHVPTSHRTGHSRTNRPSLNSEDNTTDIPILNRTKHTRTTVMNPPSPIGEDDDGGIWRSTRTRNRRAPKRRRIISMFNND